MFPFDDVIIRMHCNGQVRVSYSERPTHGGLIPSVLTHLPLDKMAAILADDNFKCIFLSLDNFNRCSLMNIVYQNTFFYFIQTMHAMPRCTHVEEVGLLKLTWRIGWMLRTWERFHLYHVTLSIVARPRDEPTAASLQVNCCFQNWTHL